MDLKKLISQMTLQQKLAQISQFNANCLHVGASGELKGYKKISLKPGESQKVSFTVTEKLLKFWSANGKFESEAGSFTAWVSDSSSVKEGVKFTLTK